eukprot:12714402-Alexandrium_andersonii.AAC.1
MDAEAKGSVSIGGSREGPAETDRSCAKRPEHISHQRTSHAPSNTDSWLRLLGTIVHPCRSMFATARRMEF